MPTNKSKIIIVVAMNHDGVIGVNNQLPWHIPEDLKYFKQVTLGKPIIMGRKTFESIGRVLPGRKNIVITRNKNWSETGVETFDDLGLAIAANSDHPDICIIGGGEIFNQAIPIANEMHLTIVNVDVENPTVFFPKFDLGLWKLQEQNEVTTESGVKCVFNKYIRK